VQVATAAETAAAVGAALPEAYVEGLEVSEEGNILTTCADRVVEMAQRADAVLLGPGFVDAESTALLLEQVVPRLDTPVVLDALGTAYLTGNLDALAHLRGRVLLTPNLTELAATLQRSAEEVEAQTLDAAAELARCSRAVVLGGARTSYVVTPSGMSWHHETRSSGLATAGSGDVKAGVVVGLVARGATPEQAAVWGAYGHGRAGDRLAGREPGFLARDLVREIPRELAALEGEGGPEG
jgi:hydroxyethylthiazole kinase-like uncharacterized protein yjeF